MSLHTSVASPEDTLPLAAFPSKAIAADKLRKPI